MGSKRSPTKSKKAEPTKKQPYQLHTIFTTFMLTRDWEDVDEMNEELKLEIWRKRALDPEGLHRSNLSGTWHSNDQLFTTTGKAGLKLREMFGNAMVEWGGAHGLKKNEPIKMRTAAWAMVYTDRGYATVHNHPNCHVSGVYYVHDSSNPGEKRLDVEKNNLSPGDLEFIDTRRGGDMLFKGLTMSSPARIKCKPGRMVIFPSCLPHMVHPVLGPGDRISVSCNGTFLPPPPEKKEVKP